MLEVIGVGYGRTGTLSLKTALERLGFGPCYHAVEFMRHPEHQARWEAAFQGNPQWEDVFAGYRSTVDFPGTAFWRELVDAYPQARVILTVREPQEWYASMRETFLAFAGPEGQPPIPGAGEGSFVRGGDWSQMMADLQDEDTAIATSSGTSRRCAATYPDTGCWFTRSGKAGNRCVTSSRSTYPPSRFPPQRRRGL